MGYFWRKEKRRERIRGGESVPTTRRRRLKRSFS
jgi:hypothetical protein